MKRLLRLILAILASPIIIGLYVGFIILIVFFIIVSSIMNLILFIVRSNEERGELSFWIQILEKIVKSFIKIYKY